MKCGTAGLVKIKSQTATVFRFKCNCWACPDCQKRLRRRLIAKAKAGRPTRLLTLTVNPASFQNPTEAAQALVDAWRRARQQLKRHHGHKAIEFLAVFEEHKSGWPHLHILLRSGFLPQRWLSKYMRERINSPIVDIRKIRTAKHAALYVAKYIAKAPERFPGTKRYWTSAQWSERPPKREKDPEALWVIAHDAERFLSVYAPALLTEFRLAGISGTFPCRSPHDRP